MDNLRHTSTRVHNATQCMLQCSHLYFSNDIARVRKSEIWISCPSRPIDSAQHSSDVGSKTGYYSRRKLVPKRTEAPTILAGVSYPNSFFRKYDSMHERSPRWLCVCESLTNFWMSKPIFVKLDMYIIIPELISTAYFNKCFISVHTSLRVSIL